MKRKSICIAFTTGLILCGCAAKFSETPHPANFQSSSQYKLQAASHWNTVSSDIAERLIEKLSSKVKQEDSLYISSSTTTPFNQAVEMQLLSSLLDKGYKVQKSPENAISININTQVVEFSPNRKRSSTSIGLPTALVSGVWFLAEIDATTAGAATAAIATADLSRNFNSNYADGAIPQTEILVNITVSNSSEFLATSNGTYYVSDSDKKLYEAAKVSVEKLVKTYPSKNLTVKGDNL